MPRPSIDYLNARRDAKPANGGKRYIVTHNIADERARWRISNAIERARWLEAIRECWQQVPTQAELAEQEARWRLHEAEYEQHVRAPLREYYRKRALGITEGELEMLREYLSRERV
jgi:hypothetical protein